MAENAYAGEDSQVIPGVGPVACLCYLAGRSPEEAAEELRADGLGDYDAAAVRELYREIGEFLDRLGHGSAEYQRLRREGVA